MLIELLAVLIILTLVITIAIPLVSRNERIKRKATETIVKILKHQQRNM